MPPESESSTTLSSDEGLLLVPLVTEPVICTAKRLAEKMKQKSANPIRFVSCTGILNVVTLGGFEPPTCGLGNRRSIHLSYRATIVFYRSSGSLLSACELPQPFTIH